MLQAKFDNLIDVQRQWKNHFTTEPPSKLTIISLVKKFKEIGSFHDLNRSGRSLSVIIEKAMKTGNEALEKCSNTSIRQDSLAMEMSRPSIHGLIVERNFWAYYPTRIQELSEDDFDRRVKFYETMLEKFNKNDRFETGWSGLTRVNSCWTAQSTVIIASTVPPLTRTQKSGQQLKAWSNGVVWSNFARSDWILNFEDSMTAKWYLEMLNEFIWPQVVRRSLFFQ